MDDPTRLTYVSLTTLLIIAAYIVTFAVVACLVLGRP
jgi:hypothetical protein